MSLKNAGKNVFEKEDGALEAFRRYLELDEKSEATISESVPEICRGGGMLRQAVQAAVPDFL